MNILGTLGATSKQGKAFRVILGHKYFGPLESHKCFGPWEGHKYFLAIGEQ